jgi:clan AA aspartic protease (TIGR02281 family)
MIVSRRVGWAGLVVAVSACATPLAPEHQERNRQLLRVARECERQHPGVTVKDIKPDGALDASYRDSLAESGRPFMACYWPKAEPLLVSKGRLAERPGLLAVDLVPIEFRGTAPLVTVRVNGSPVTLVLDTGASLTSINTEPAARAGLVPSRGSFHSRRRAAGGHTNYVPLVRAKTLTVGAYTVEDIDVGVYDVTPGWQGVDGLLGTDFLRFFRVALDRDARRLRLEPGRPGTAEVAALAGATNPAQLRRLVQPTFWLDHGQAGLLPESGRVAVTSPARTLVAVEETVGGSLLVPVRINGAAATLLLNYRFEKTWVTPAVAARAGLEPAGDGPRVLLASPQGDRRAMALAVAQRLQVGDLTVEGLHVGVLDPGEYAVYDGDGRPLVLIDGQLGKDFLRLVHWRHIGAGGLLLERLD